MKVAIYAFLTALLLAIAAQTVWMIAVGWGGVIVAALRPGASDSPYTVESVAFLKDGTLIVMRSTTEFGTRRTAYRTIDGQPLKNVELQKKHWGGLLLQMNPSHVPNRLWRDRIVPFAVPDLRKPFASRYSAWYSVEDLDGGVRFVGYDFTTNLPLGYLGRDGFRTSPPPGEDRFPLVPGFLKTNVPGSEAVFLGDPSWQPVLFLPLPEEVVEVDLAKRSTVSVWKGAAIDACLIQDLYEEEATGAEIDVWPIVTKALVRTRTHLHMLGTDRREVFSVEIPKSLRSEMLVVNDATERGVTLSTLKWYRTSRLVHVAWLSADAAPKILDVPLDNPVSDVSSTWPEIGLAAPNAAGIMAVAFSKTLESENDDGSPRDSADAWKYFRFTLAVVLGVSAILAALAWRRERRYGLRFGSLWACFVLLFGVPGWFAYRWHCRWPPLEACPSCGAMVPRDRQTCFRCGKPFPPPGRESFEIRD